MQLVGNKLVIPLFDAELSKEKSYQLCDGLSVFTLPNDYEEHLLEAPPLIARYEESLTYMKCGLAIESSVLEHNYKLRRSERGIEGMLLTNWNNGSYQHSVYDP